MEDKQIPLLASEKVALFRLLFWVAIILIGIIAAVIVRISNAMNKDEDGYNKAISEVCAFYKVEIVEYDEHVNLYKLSIDQETWDSNDDTVRRQFCRNCQEAFDRMMHKYGMTSDSDRVSLMVYRNKTLVASVINGVIDTSHDFANELQREINDAAQEFMTEFGSIYNEIMRESSTQNIVLKTWRI